MMVYCCFETGHPRDFIISIAPQTRDFTLILDSRLGNSAKAQFTSLPGTIHGRGENAGNRFHIEPGLPFRHFWKGSVHFIAGDDPWTWRKCGEHGCIEAPFVYSRQVFRGLVVDEICLY
jgi:hypothetical protein